MKRRIRLSESDLHRVIKESVKRILKETHVVPGVTQVGHYEPVPYDDDYVEKNGPVEPYWQEEPEKKETINSALNQLANRIERLMKKMTGHSVAVTVREDVHSNERSNGDWVDSTYARIGVRFNPDSKGGRELAMITKIIAASEIVRNYRCLRGGPQDAEFELWLNTNRLEKERTLGRGDVSFEKEWGKHWY